MSSTIFLVGARASGKTTVGRRLATLLGWDFVDTDQWLTQHARMSVAQIIEAHGWEGFRQKESEALATICAAYATPGKGLVLATGGGMVLAENNRRFMRERGTVLYLHAAAPLLAERLAAAPEHDQRPPLTELSLADEVAQVLRLREPLYREAAHHVLDGSLEPEHVAQIAQNLVHHPGAVPCA